jgi:hypothetical protein
MSYFIKGGNTMPTKTYSNLSEDKRLKIDNALKSEYKNFP